MSDPVTNVEIEDVLSSIRRLVSVDSGRSRPAGADTAPLQDSTAKAGRLVLTQNYRISTGPSEQVCNTGPDTLERRIAELEAAVNAQAAEYEPDGSEDTAQHRPTAVPRTAAPSDGVLRLDRLVASAELAGADASGKPKQDEAPGVDLDALAKSDEPDIAIHDAAPMEEAEVEHAAMWSDDRAAKRPRHDDDFASHYAPTDDALSLGADDALIDEETLRDMVAEIVRDELQGALGERITRNVRKLVRREIMRAISIRDFD